MKASRPISYRELFPWTTRLTIVSTLSLSFGAHVVAISSLGTIPHKDPDITFQKGTQTIQVCFVQPKEIVPTKPVAVESTQQPPAVVAIEEATTELPVVEKPELLEPTPVIETVESTIAEPIPEPQPIIEKITIAKPHSVEPKQTIAAQETEAEPIPEEVVETPTPQVFQQDSPEEQATADVIEEALIQINPAPRYPKLARRLGKEGTVVLEVTISESGKPLQATIRESAGYKLLDQSALKTVLNEWRFKPATKDGAAVETIQVVEVSFKLE